MFRSIGDEWNAGAVLNMLGMTVGYLGDYVQARSRLEESLAVFRALDDPWGIGFGLLDLGHVMRHRGDLAAARALLEEGLPLLRQSGDVFQVLEILIDLGGLALEGDEFDRAVSLACEGLLLLRDSGMRWYLPEAVELAAGLTAAQGLPEQAARLFGAAENAREVTGVALQAQGKNAYARDVRATQAGLGEETFRTAWSDGRTLSPERAIDEALTVATHLATLAKATDGPLTQREQEVAGLTAHGLTNRQIAEQLVISPRTADRHVSNILDKLGLATRGQVAAWAVVRTAMAAGSG